MTKPINAVEVAQQIVGPPPTPVVGDWLIEPNVTQYFCNGSGSPATGGQRYILATATSTDFNHDGKPDYVLYNGGTHQTAVCT